MSSRKSFDEIQFLKRQLNSLSRKVKFLNLNTFSSDITLEGNTTIGDASTDIVTVTAQLTASQGGYFGDKVGVGTAAAMNRLQINHSAADHNDGLMIVRADSTTADTNLLGGIGFDSTDGNVPFTITKASCFIAAYAAEDHGTGDKGGDLVFGCTKINDDDDTTSHEYMRISDDGKVGIGTSSPNQELHIENATETILQLTRKDTSISDGNSLGAINFGGTTDNGSNYDYNSAVIKAEAEGTWDTTDTDSGARLVFKVTPDGSATNATALTIKGNGKVGIGTESPNQDLHIEDDAGNSAASIQLTRKDTGGITAGNDLGSIYFGGTEASSPSDSDYNFAGVSFIAEAAETWNVGGGSAGSRLLIKVTPNGSTSAAEVMRIANDGNVGIGCTPSQPFHVLADNASGYAAKFKNDGDNSNRYGIIIDCGADDNSGTNIPIQFRDGNGSNMGKIHFSGGSVQYGAFTAYHPAALPEGINNYDYGTIVKINSTASTIYGKSVQYEVEKTTTAQDKAVFGVYSVAIGEEYNEDGTPAQEHNRHQIWCLGDGHILVCSEGGNIETGDYICSSYTAGHGMKQNDDLLHNYTVAKATEPVDWSTESGVTKLISCTYHAS